MTVTQPDPDDRSWDQWTPELLAQGAYEAPCDIDPSHDAHWIGSYVRANSHTEYVVRCLTCQ